MCIVEATIPSIQDNNRVYFMLCYDLQQCQFITQQWTKLNVCIHIFVKSIFHALWSLLCIEYKRCYRGKFL